MRGETPVLHGDGVRHFELAATLWHKERLLNLLLASLPERFTKIVWLDADVLFEDPAWAPKTSALLDRCAVVQCFDQAVHLSRGAHEPRADDLVLDGYVAMARHPGAVHGETGFAWAIRRDALGVEGWYDRAILGGGDHLMAHVFAGAATSHPCIMNLIGTAASAASFASWRAQIRTRLLDRPDSVPGTLFHLWHGERAMRRYRERLEILTRHGFDPDTDIAAARNGTWMWSSDKPALHAEVARYFEERAEDG